MGKRKLAVEDLFKLAVCDESSVIARWQGSGICTHAY